MEKIIDLGQMIKLLDYNIAALKEIFALNKINHITANKDILNDIINKAEEINNWEPLFTTYYSEIDIVCNQIEYINIVYYSIRLVIYRFSHFTYTDNKKPKRVVFYKLLKPNLLEQ